MELPEILARVYDMGAGPNSDKLVVRKETLVWARQEIEKLPDQRGHFDGELEGGCG